ncbi:hypothetical protein FB45DRAFT_1025434 [Roridomyces roridus]|uniref:BTB domain-containing protein n=1 Tax=Roridomyces roridus TaxID=1738132 RepID=A0AAD7BYN1_9AGAR|nr:hypothetical protein FB45DRAFT_1025434 [Roridomyces roridus]
MSDAPPPAKRRRQSSPTEDTTPSRSHIWKPFGDIVLQAECTQFRVNRDVLATQSSVFADMFSVPQPPGEPLTGSCCLKLDILYRFEVEERLPFDVIAALLRLGRKYAIHAAESSATRRIHGEYPTTLEDFDAIEQIVGADGVLFDFLNLVEQLAQENIFKGLRRLDGSRVTLAPNIVQSLTIGFQPVLAFQNKTYAWLDNDDIIPAESCKQRSKCTKGCHALRRWLAWDEKRDVPDFFGLFYWDSAWSEDHGICDACNEAGKGAYQASRIKVWEALPGFFGLPPWAELKDVEG